MLATNIPYKFAQPWAVTASPGFITKPIPVVSSSGVKASQALGFPPATSLNLAAGGTPPDIADFNGMMNYVTSWNQWYQIGGPITFDTTQAASIGGYPKGTQLQSTTDARITWINNVDNNLTNPDAGGSNWVAINSYPWNWIATQTYSAGILNTGFDSAGFGIRFVAGQSGSQYGVGFRNDGANFYLLSTPNGQPFGTWNNFRPLIYRLSDGFVTIDATGAGTTFGGSMSTAVDFASGRDISAARDLRVSGNGAVSGFLVASSARLSVGARGTNDGARVVTLSDFTSVSLGSINSCYTINPWGVIDQTTQVAVSGVAGAVVNTNITLPVAFPRSIFDAVCCFGGTSPPSRVGICCTPSSLSTVLVTVTIDSSFGSGVGTFAVVIRSRGI